ncbi:MAG TPA: hypothetical protein VF584_00265 [Longimicrobium sp.]|jgi:hypothetical protein
MRESAVERVISPESQVEPELVLYVEGAFDAAVVPALLGRAGYPVDRLLIAQAGGVQALKKLLVVPSREFGGARVAALVDSDQINVPDAVEHATQRLGRPCVPVFSAVPSVEAWLLADPEAVGKALKLKHEDGLPDFVFGEKDEPHALRMRRNVRMALLVIEHMDVATASARSPSLRAFLKGIGEIMGADTSYLDRAQSRGFARETLSSLLAEVTSEDTVIYRTIDGSRITAREMMRHLDSGTDLGREFASDLLRISRDLLARQAQR